MSETGPHLWHEMTFKADGNEPIAGLDEAGRGALAGPVVAAAVILPVGDVALVERLEGVRDSKSLSPKRREELYPVILRVADATGYGSSSAEEIDEMGIVPATRLAMRRALENLEIEPRALIIDYMHLKFINLPQESLVRGEQQSLSVAAASIVAKVIRDRIMLEMDEKYPDYGFALHKGYGTDAHKAAIKKKGPCEIHRRSFSPIKARLITPEEEEPDEPDSTP